MHSDPTVDRPSVGFYTLAIVVAAIASFGWLQGDNEQLFDEIFLVGSWVISFNNVVGFSFKRGFEVYAGRRKSTYIENFLIPLSMLATVFYLIGNFILSPMLVA